MNLPKIKYTGIVYSSNRDLNGNCYHAFRLYSTTLGRTVCGTLGSASDLKMFLMNERKLNYGEFVIFETALPKRQFNATVKDWAYVTSWNDISASLE